MLTSSRHRGFNATALAKLSTRGRHVLAYSVWSKCWREKGVLRRAGGSERQAPSLSRGPRVRCTWAAQAECRNSSAMASLRPEMCKFIGAIARPSLDSLKGKCQYLVAIIIRRTHLMFSQQLVQMVEPFCGHLPVEKSVMGFESGSEK